MVGGAGYLVGDLFGGIWLDPFHPPRVGSEYGYVFLWLLLSVCFLMWIMIEKLGAFP